MTVKYQLSDTKLSTCYVQYIVLGLNGIQDMIFSSHYLVGITDIVQWSGTSLVFVKTWGEEKMKALKEIKVIAKIEVGVQEVDKCQINSLDFCLQVG